MPATPAPRNGTAAPPGRSAGDQRLFADAVPVRDILSVLWGRIWLVTAVTLLIVLMAGAYLQMRPQTYQASALIRLENTRRSITGEFEEATRERPVSGNADEILSQIQVLKGRTVLGEVADREGLRLVPVTPGFPIHRLADVAVTDEAVPEAVFLRLLPEAVVIRTAVQEQRAGYGAPVELDGLRFTVLAAPAGPDSATLVVQPRDAAINFVQAGLQVFPRQNTDAIDVTFTSVDSVMSRRVVNAVAEVFQQYTARTAQQQALRRRLFLEEQLRTTDSVYAAAQQNLSDFRGSSRAYHSRDRSGAHQQALLNLDIRREELAASRRMYQTLLNTVVQSGGEARQRALRTLVSAPDVAANPVISQLFAQVARYEAERDQLRAGPLGSTAESPDVRRLNSLIHDTELRLTDAAHSHVASLDARIAALDELRTRSDAEVQRMPAMEAEEDRLASHAASIGRVVDQLRSALLRARMAEAVEVGHVEIVYLAPDAVPSRGNKRIKLLLAGVFGLLLGGSSAFALEAVNTSIRRPQDVASVLQVPRLAIIPRMEKPQRRWLMRSEGAASPPAGARSGSTGTQVGFRTADAYRTLRANLMFSSRTTAFRTLVVTSTAPREGKTTTASNLAVSFAQQGLRVLLIDADLRAPRLHQAFNVPQTPGLSSLLDERCLPAEAITPTAVPGLHLIASGERPVDPSELLGGSRLRSFLAECAERYDLVILDSPPVLGMAETSVVAAECDAVLFVVRAGLTDRRAAEEAMQQLAFAGARVIGAALNDPTDLVASYGAYYGAYGDQPRTAPV